MQRRVQETEVLIGAQATRHAGSNRRASQSRCVGDGETETEREREWLPQQPADQQQP